MIVTAYSVRPDEDEFFVQYGKELGLEVRILNVLPDIDNLSLAEGSDAISIVTNRIDRAMVEKIASMGIHLLSTRTAGFDHIDTKACDEYGIKYGNVTYSTSTVAEFAVMLMVMGLRKVPSTVALANVQDFTVTKAKRGKELRTCTVGVVGTGKIGRRVTEILSGYGCKIIAYDLHPSAPGLEYVSLDELLSRSDVITFHIPMNPGEDYLIGKEEFGKMKDGVVIVNTARGGIIDTYALVDAVEQGKVGFALLDVVEDEKKMYYSDYREVRLDNRRYMLLKGYPQIYVTPHLAFFTNEGVSEMVLHSLEWIKENFPV